MVEQAVSFGQRLQDKDQLLLELSDKMDELVRAAHGLDRGAD
jgi:hypothetical protein